jgi:pyrimidine-nucleoside phosphorylase
MRAVDLIIRKRDGAELAPEEVDFLVRGFTTGEIPDYQFSSLLMAIVLKGMTPSETARMTRAMIDSGDVMDLEGVPGPLVDKHSTGGVGDKVSLVLAPLAAACGLRVPMMSGRSLGHTGGTLDKLESIPGYRTDLSPKRFREALEKIGFAMIGQSESVVPADRRMYALRDVTGTVESVPLITASIMSKKFAEGAQALLMDVKAGAGAFMKDRAQAAALARSLVATGAGLGRRVAAMITDMDQPLGMAVGNFLEVRECIEILQGRGPRDEVDLIVQEASRMIWLGGLTAGPADGEGQARERLRDGSAWSIFLKNVEFKGGDTDVLLHPEKGPRAPLEKVVACTAGGFVRRVDAYATGIASVILGAGRSRKEDRVFPGVGILLARGPGEPVRPGEELCRLYGQTQAALDEAARLMEGAVHISAEKVLPAPRLLEEITRA